MKPATDLCRHTCQQNTNLLMKSANVPDQLKSQRLQMPKNILNLLRYNGNVNEQCTAAKKSMMDCDASVMHYSFDYAQQVHYLCNTQQPGPIFFKTVQKCDIFGVSCELTSSQVNYLIDEGDGIGKGANATYLFANTWLQSEASLSAHRQLYRPKQKQYNSTILDVESSCWLKRRH